MSFGTTYWTGYPPQGRGFHPNVPSQPKGPGTLDQDCPTDSPPEEPHGRCPEYSNSEGTHAPQGQAKERKSHPPSFHHCICPALWIGTSERKKEFTVEPFIPSASRALCTSFSTAQHNTAGSTCAICTLTCLLYHPPPSSITITTSSAATTTPPAPITGHTYISFFLRLLLWLLALFSLFLSLALISHALIPSPPPLPLRFFPTRHSPPQSYHPTTTTKYQHPTLLLTNLPFLFESSYNYAVQSPYCYIFCPVLPVSSAESSEI